LAKSPTSRRRIGSSGSPRGIGSSGKKLGFARSVRCDDKLIYVTLTDGRAMSAPLTPRLQAATQRQRDQGVVEDFGTGLHWEEIDEDVGVNYVLGVPEDELEAFAGFSDQLPKR